MPERVPGFHWRSVCSGLPDNRQHVFLQVLRREDAASEVWSAFPPRQNTTTHTRNASLSPARFSLAPEPCLPYAPVPWLHLLSSLHLCASPCLSKCPGPFDASRLSVQVCRARALPSPDCQAPAATEVAPFAFPFGAAVPGRCPRPSPLRGWPRLARRAECVCVCEADCGARRFPFLASPNVSPPPFHAQLLFARAPSLAARGGQAGRAPLRPPPADSPRCPLCSLALSRCQHLRLALLPVILGIVCNKCRAASH